jgi:hypothetical protein
MQLSGHRHLRFSGTTPLVTKVFNPVWNGSPINHDDDEFYYILEDRLLAAATVCRVSSVPPAGPCGPPPSGARLPAGMVTIVAVCTNVAFFSVSLAGHRGHRSGGTGTGPAWCVTNVIFKVTGPSGPSPLRGQICVRHKGGLPGPPQSPTQNPRRPGGLDGTALLPKLVWARGILPGKLQFFILQYRSALHTVIKHTHTSLPLECHRNAINRNHFGSSARHSTKA